MQIVYQFVFAMKTLERLRVIPFIISALGVLFEYYEIKEYFFELEGELLLNKYVGSSDLRL